MAGTTSVSALTEDAGGQLYGSVTSTIGTNPAATTLGTIFKLAKDSSTFTVLRTSYRESSAAEGSEPRGLLAAIPAAACTGFVMQGGGRIYFGRNLAADV